MASLFDGTSTKVPKSTKACILQYIPLICFDSQEVQEDWIHLEKTGIWSFMKWKRHICNAKGLDSSQCSCSSPLWRISQYEFHLLREIKTLITSVPWRTLILCQPPCFCIYFGPSGHVPHSTVYPFTDNTQLQLSWSRAVNKVYTEQWDPPRITQSTPA